MLYQKLLAGTDPFYAILSESNAFEKHCHPEIEISYCFKGAYTIVIGKQEHVLHEGDLAIVNPMVAHELKAPLSPDSLRLTVEIGPTFFGEHFAPFVTMNRENAVLLLKQNRHLPFYVDLETLLDKTAVLLHEKPPFFNLLLKSNLYTISAVLLQLFAERTSAEPAIKSQNDIEKIGAAVNMIYNCYHTPLTLDEVSAQCGYSKSNFCKVFKTITGESFHVLLNRHRIDVACLKLQETKASVEDIALSVGFADSKSFCRVFKKVMGKSAGEFRHKKAPN